ncbi:Dehydrogenase [Penicillium herquei]|nr:Dehydrogenase [Penicillium herquei]
MSTQSALLLTEIGKPLAKGSLPKPDSYELKAKEILVKITAAGLAPLDQKFRDRGELGIGARLPAVISGDVVGEVIEGGPENEFPIGTHIFSQMLFNLPQSGALQEYTIVNGEYAAAVPNNVSDTEAALYPINLVTAAMSIFSANGLGLPLPETPEAKGFDYASQEVVIIGSGCNTGKLAVQLCKLAGIGTIIAIASPSSKEILEQYGATHLIARQDANIEEQVRAIVGDELLYVYDAYTFGDLGLGASLLSNKNKGVFVHNGSGTIPDAVLSEKKEGLDDKRILGFSHFIPEFGRLLWQKIPDWLVSGQIQPLAYKTIEGLDEEKVNEGLDEYAAGRSAERYHVKIA